jgi:hypothetical protein
MVGSLRLRQVDIGVYRGRLADKSLIVIAAGAGWEAWLEQELPVGRGATPMAACDRLLELMLHAARRRKENLEALELNLEDLSCHLKELHVPFG